MSKRLGLLIVMMLFVSLMTGCFGSDDSSTPTPAATSSVVITGTIPALSAPAGAPNYMVNYGTNYEMGVFDAATMTEITGSAVVINGTSYTATVPASAVSVTALVVIRHKTTGKVVYSAIAGKLPTTTQMSAASVTKVNVSGVNLDGESTALATIAKDKGVVAPSIPASTSVPTMSAAVKSEIETAVGAATVTAIKDAITAVQTVLNASTGVSEATKSSILSALDATLSNVLNAFVAAVKDASGVITSAGGATTVTVGGSTINSTTTPAQVTDAVNHVTVVTVTAVTNPSDIAVANGTALSAITFPTTVTVTLSNATTATRSVVWSTTSTPAYNANVEGAYTFTGTVDGTTLTATVKVNVGIVQLKVATPTFSPAAGTFTAAQSVTIATTTDGATIHYTVDGTEPTTSSPTYTSAISVSATTTVKAMAVKTGMTSSDVATATYTISISLVPVISAERAVKQANGDIVVTWTTNIVTPTAAKVMIIKSEPFVTPDYQQTETVSTTTSHSVTIAAANVPSTFLKFRIGYIIGEDGTFADILATAIVEEAQVVADPVFAPVAGTYTTAQSVTITCATEGAEIYYTTDGSAPSSLTTKYTGAIALSTSATTNFKAIAVKTGMTDSNVVSATYVLNISTTKVLTGIALAKATDTVEAETAYTLPTAKASYDDNSVPADVTVSWVEVLAGGTTAVVLPLTKTTAGTYNFQASYTENGVTKTADFVLVVTEKVPVKTLQSITVTANPTAPTCLVGGTTSVALTVVANYLTGAVESTEEVTTYTTSSNWANGVFTAASTVAGTENITVTFEGKTADVAVTVTAEAPVVTTVTVTLPTTMTEASATQAVVLVKDQFGATMTTGFTTTYATTTGTSTVSNTGLVTAGSYDANTAANNAHVLTVTVTPTTGTAVSGTANFTVTADSTKPTIVSVSALDNKTIVVTYSKKVSSTATTITNYSLYHGTTGVTAGMVSAGASNSQITATALFTDSTQKIVKITISAIGSSLSGYPAGGLDAVNYRLYVSNVTDTTSNANTIIASSNTQFMGTTTPDSNKPVINAMAYNKGTGTLVITLDKAVTNALTYTNIKFNGTVLTAAVTNNSQTSGQENKISVTVASADKATIAALTGDITVTILADAIADSNGNKNVETSMVASLTVPPTMTSAVYDEATNTLTMGFSQTLDLSTSTLRALFTNNTNFKMKSTEYGTVALNSTDTLLTTSNNATVQVLLSNDHANAFEAIATHTSPKVLAIVDSFQNTNGDKNLAQDDSTTDYPGVTMTVTKDSTKPEVTSITFDETTKKLVFNFNVAVNKSTAVPANILLFMDKNKTAFTTSSLTGLTPTEVSDAKTLTFDLSSSNVFNAGAVNLKASQQGPTDAATPTTYASYVTFVADTFTKSGSVLKNVAVTDKATTTTITYTDNVAPALSSSTITVTDKVTISFTFDEKVNKTDAETAANYKIYLMSGGVKQTTQLTVNAVKMTDYDATTNTYTQKTVQIVTGTQTEGATYLLEVSNVKDLAGNVISATDAAKYSKQFTGSTNSAPAPKVISSKIRDNGNQQLDTADYIAVTFDRPVKLNTSSTQTVNQNFDLTIGTADFAASYSKDNVSMSTDTADLDCVVLIKVDSTLASDATKKIVVGTTKIDALGGDLIKDKYSDTAAAAGTAVVIQSPLGATTITEALLTDVDGSGTINAGDTLKVTFSNPLKANNTTALAASDFAVKDSGGVAKSLGSEATVTTTITNTVSSNTVTITLGKTGLALLPTHLSQNGGAGATINIASVGRLLDSWGISLDDGGVTTDAKKKLSTAAVAAPYLTKVEWVDVDASGTGTAADFVYLTFNVPVYVSGTADGATADGPGAVNMWKIAGSAYGTGTYPMKVLANPNQVRLTLTGAATLTPTVTTFEMNSAVMTASEIANFAGNSIVAATTINKVSVSSDTTAPTITSAAFISESKVKVVFSKAVNITNYKRTNGSAGLALNGDITKEFNSNGFQDVGVPVLDSTDTTGKTVIFTLEDSTDGDGKVTPVQVSISEQTNGIPAGLTTGIKIMASNGITDIAGNALVATQTGANYVEITKDTTAPDYAMLAYELAAKKANLGLTNAAGTGSINETAGATMALGELSLLEVFIGASTPAAGTTATGTASTFAGAFTASQTNIITGLAMATTGYKIYYRLSDRVANKSAWIDSGNTVAAATLPNATYIKKTSSSTAANEAYLSGNTLYVGDNTVAQAYDVTNNATVKSIMTNLAASDTFTIASGLVNAISAANLTTDASVALTTADLAATVTVTGDAGSKLTLTGTGPSTKLVLAAANGGYTVTATAIPAVDVAASTGTITVSAAVPTVTLTGNVANLSIGANVATALALGANNITTKLTITAGTVADVTGAGTIAALDMNGGTLTAYNGGTIASFTLNGGTVTTITKAKMTALVIGADAASTTAMNMTITAGGIATWDLTATGATAASSSAANVAVAANGAYPAARLTAGAAGAANITFTGNNSTVAATSDGTNVTQLVITSAN